MVEIETASPRGEPSLWPDGEFLHLWTEAGGEGTSLFSGDEGMKDAGGVRIADEVMDHSQGCASRSC